MTVIEIITAIIIHLVIPVIGLLTYLRLISKMQAEKVANPPSIDFLFIFANYGGLLLVILTTLFWKWSGIASLATFYLILGAPIVMGIIAFRNYKSRQLSKYHRWTFEFGVLYFLIAPFSLLIATAFE